MKITVLVAGREVVVEAPDAGGDELLLDGRPAQAEALPVRPGLYSVLAGGRSYEVALEPAAGASEEARASVDGAVVAVRVEDARRRALRSAQAAQGAGGATGRVATVAAPMPGRVVAVPAQAGVEVETGQTVVVLEAMKMESALAAPQAGVIADVLVSPGQTVQQRQPLVTIRTAP